MDATQRISWIAPAPREQSSVPSWIAPALVEAPRDEAADLARLHEVQSLPPAAVAVVEMREQIDAKDLEAMRARIASLEESLRDRVADLAGVRERILADAAPEVARLAVAIAERVVGASAREHPEIVRSWIAEGLATLGAKGAVIVRVSPAIASMLPAETAARVEVDAALRELDCVVESDVSRVEVGARTRVDAIAEHIGVDREGA